MASAARSAAILRAPEIPLDLRYVGPIAGCYTLSDRRELVSGDVEVFACRTQSISALSAVVMAPVAGEPGERITARLDGIGIVKGRIERETKDGFVFEIVATPLQQAKLAAKIDWLKKKAVRQQSDKRAAKRFMPRDPRSTLALMDGSIAKCFVIDLSANGAAVSAYLRPEIGTQLILGKLPGRVVRHLDVGFALQFDTPDADAVEKQTTGYVPADDVAPSVWPGDAPLPGLAPPPGG